MSSGFPEDLTSKIPLFAELQKLLAWQGGPVNFDLARQVATAAVGVDDPPVTEADSAAVADALRLADVWLDAATVLPAAGGRSEAWTRVQWVEQTLPRWRTLIDPVASRVVATMGAVLPEQAQGLGGPMAGVMSALGSLLFGAQAGQGIGSLATSVLGTYDVGVPLAPEHVTALVPANLTAFGAGLGVEIDDVRTYVAMHESAAARLNHRAGWLAGRVVAAVEDYARGLTVDHGALEEAMAGLDPTDPESLQRAMSGGLLEPPRTAEQQAALTRLETLLALAAGWVTDVVDGAAAPHLPSAAALGEAMRRRRATGGPAEQTFATLVGLELRPRRVREAAAFWLALRSARGVDGRDQVWDHPDLLPSTTDLDDPTRYLTDD